MEKKTSLYDEHVRLGGKMVPFAGYLMPIQYGTGVITEHMAVRQAAGLFDVSHMGEVILEGGDAMATLQKLLTNNMEDMAVGGCRYSPMCNENGGVVDDLIVYRLGETKFLLVVNASNRDKDVAWMRKWLVGDTVLDDVSDGMAELAIQGPKAEAILSGMLGADADKLPVKYYTFTENVEVAGVDCLVSRTGYTGEDGFELYCDAAAASRLWNALLAAGEADGLIPCGLGARDTLRLEAAMPLYGHEMSEELTPQEANIGFFVKMDKADFNGKAAMEARGKPSRRRTGLKMVDRGIAREGCEVYKDGQKIGVVTSGTQLPYLKYAGAMALLDVDFREPGTLVEVDVRGRRIAAEVVKTPFYKRESV